MLVAHLDNHSSVYLRINDQLLLAMEQETTEEMGDDVGIYCNVTESNNFCLSFENSYRFWGMVLCWVLIPISIFGFIANILNVCVRIQPAMNSSINFLLIGLAVADGGLVLLNAVITVPGGLAMYYHPFLMGSPWGPSLVYIVKWGPPLTQMFLTASTIILVLVTYESFLAVCHPFTARVLCTVRNAGIGLLLVAVFSVSYNACRFFEIQLVTDENGTVSPMAGLVVNPNYERIYTLWLYLIVMFALPFLIIGYLNLRIIAQLRKSAQFRRLMSSQEKREHSTTVMLLLITANFLISHTVPFAIRIFKVTYFERAQAMNQTGAEYLRDSFPYNLVNFLVILSALLITINSSINFPIYCGFSKQFRRSFAETILGQPKYISRPSSQVGQRTNHASFRLTLLNSEKGSVTRYSDYGLANRRDRDSLCLESSPKTSATH